MREFRLQLRIAPHQRVIVGVAKSPARPRYDRAVVPRDLGGETLQLGRRLRASVTPPPAAASACARASSVTCGAREHAGDLLAAARRRRARWTLVRVTRPSWLFSISRWLVAARRDLRAVGDDQHLAALGEPVQPLADRAGDRAADAAVDLVEDHRRRAALLGQRDLEREDEARQLAARGDPDQRPERRAGIGRDLELDPVAARARPCASASGSTTVRKRAASSFSGASSPRHRRIEPRGRRAARAAVSASAAASIGGARRPRPRASSAASPSSPASIASSLRAQAPRAAPAARRARPGACGRARGARTAASRPPRAGPDRRPAPRRRAPSASSASAASITARSSAASASASSGMLAGDPVEPPRRLAELGEAAFRALRAAPRSRRARRRAARPSASSARSAGERLLLARLGREPVELGDRMFEPVAVARGGLQRRRARRGERAPRPRASRCQARSAAPRVDPAEGVEQGAVAARVEQAAIVMLAVDLDEQRRRARAAAPAETGWSLTKARLPPSALTMRRMTSGSPGSPARPFSSSSAERGMVGGELEGDADRRLRLAGAHQAAVGARAEREAERVEQDRLAGAGLAGQHAEARPEFEVERLDQDDVADREARSASATSRRHRACRSRGRVEPPHGSGLRRDDGAASGRRRRRRVLLHQLVGALDTSRCSG